MRSSTVPLSWILKSPIVDDYLSQRLDEGDQEDFFIGDFGSGRNAEVPVFFLREYQCMVKDRVPKFTVYCVDMRTLRLENLFGKFRDEGITSNARTVVAKLETMINHASFPLEQEEYLVRNLQEKTSLDQYIMEKLHLPPHCFHLGVMNKDLVGYMSEYYETETDMRGCLKSIHDTLHSNALLIVTQPCLMYRVDNLRILRDNSFHIEDIIDVDLKTGTPSFMDDSANIESFSKPNHFSFLVVSPK